MAPRLWELGEDEALRRHQKITRGPFISTKSTDWKAEFRVPVGPARRTTAPRSYIDVSRSLKGVIFGDAFPEGP